MIRRAEPEDIHALSEMGRAFFVEAGWSARATFDAESFSHTCGVLMDHGILLVAVEKEKVVGMAAAGIASSWWNRNVLTAQELFWYVDPRHRKGHGHQLMGALEVVATSLGVQLFSMSAEEGLRSTALNRIYRQRGYWPAEKVFWKDLSGGAQ